MMLFKYVSNPDFILEDGYIRATQLSALNDPFEANYDKKGLSVKIGDIRTVNRNMSGHCIGTYLDSKSLDIRTLFAQDRYVRTA